MKKSEITVKITEENRLEILSILDMFNETVFEYSRKGMKKGDREYSYIHFNGEFWLRTRGNGKTKATLQQLKEILAEENLKVGDYVVCKNKKGEQGVFKISTIQDGMLFYKERYSSTSGFRQRGGAWSTGSFIRYATIQDLQLLKNGNHLDFPKDFAQVKGSPLTEETAQELIKVIRDNFSVKGVGSDFRSVGCFSLKDGTVERETESKPSIKNNVWYKNKYGSLIYKINERRSYGFMDSGTWFDEVETLAFTYFLNNWTPATTKEVTEALTKEAIKRGLVKGVKFVSPDGTDYGYTMENDEYTLCEEGFGFHRSSSTITQLMYNGKWATIIPTEEYKEGDIVIATIGEDEYIIKFKGYLKGQRKIEAHGYILLKNRHDFICKGGTFESIKRHATPEEVDRFNKLDDPLYEIKKAYSEGKVIEFRRKGNNSEWDIATTPMWSKHYDYRIQPQPQPKIGDVCKFWDLISNDFTIGKLDQIYSKEGELKHIYKPKGRQGSYINATTLTQQQVIDLLFK